MSSTKWEYRTLQVTLQQGCVTTDYADEQLNHLGDDGWELVSVSPILRASETVFLVHHLRRLRETERRVGFQK